MAEPDAPTIGVVAAITRSDKTVFASRVNEDSQPKLNKTDAE